MARAIYARLDPGCERRQLAACMRELDTDLRRLRVCKVDYPLERRDLRSVQSPASSGEMRASGTTAVASMLIPPAPRVAKPYRPNCYIAAQCALSERDTTHADVHEVPVRCVAIVRTVLAHRRLAPQSVSIA
jgi:hypothetical protein